LSIDTTVAREAGEAQAAPSPRQRRSARETAGWAAGWLALLLVAAWMQRLTPGWLPAAGAAAAAWALLARSVPPRWRVSVVLAFAAVLALAGRTQHALWRVATDWEGVRATVEERAIEQVGEGMNSVFDRGGQAVLRVAEVAGAARAPAAELFEGVERVRRWTGVSAVAVFDPAGTPLVWAGEHRGTVPDSVRRGLTESSFSAGPLFGYVYFSERLTGGNIAMAALLLESHVEVGEGMRPYAERFARRYGILPRFTTPELAQGEIWDWATAQGPILSVFFATLTQNGWRQRLEQRGREEAAAAWLLAAALLAAAGYRSGRRDPGVPVAALTASLLVMPLGELLGKVGGVAGAFSPARFVLPLPGDLTLGGLLLVLTGGTLWLLARRRPLAAADRLPFALRVALAGGALVGAVALVRGSVAAGVLADQPSGGPALVAALTLLAALPLFLLLGRAGEAGRTRLLPVAAGVVLAGVLAFGAVEWWRPERELPLWTAAAWALPAALVSLGIPRAAVRRAALLPWAAAVWIACSLALANLWTAHLGERLHQAEREVARLGTEPDPFLDFLLRQFSEDVLRLDAEGRRGVSLLYQAWVEAGLAREGYEGRVTLWEGGEPRTELRLADAELPPQRVAALLASARERDEPRLERLTDVPGLHYLLVVPLTGGQSVSVAVPPREYLGRSAALARFLDPRDPAADGAGGASLTLVPAPEGEGPPPPAAAGPVRWVEAENGWRSETRVRFPRGTAQAHLLVQVPSRFILVTRGVLALLLVLAGAAALWALARTLCGEPLGIDPARRGWLLTFRGRLTVALFLFFLLPMAAFGATAYRALSREVVRTAVALADRALTQAAYETRDEPLRELSRRVGAELLLYRDGVLTQAATPEVIDLGLYHTWLTPETFLDLSVGEAVERVEERRLAGHAYLLAYRRLAERQVLATPTPLAAGEIVRRQRELADVVALAGLLGAALSVVLALLVARALSRPIDALSEAASAVGSGDLGVRLPAGRPDEFGRVFRAFNRMVQGLRETRAALVGETRRTEAIVAQAGTGVVALDARARVQLINPRAEEILGVAVPPGAPIPDGDPLPAAVAGAVREFLGSGERERAEEREVEGRVVRLRMRRLEVEEGEPGAVLVLEDVTSELRSARVLAWGEMARQVAHEIKNPLTPIKLAVQHVRRAHADGRPDFEKILERNVEAVLREIDHLGEISRAFARFGTPAEARAGAEPVDVARVAAETLALYRGGRDGIDYVLDVDPGVPPVLARAGELKEVLVNLLENARAALDGSGAVRISAAPDGAGRVRVAVADTGEGIPAESLPRIFEPQFSTRTSGTGLGLAIVKRLVESWGGEVFVESAAGEGTVVHLRLRAAGA
jgi:two-component system, NtrC family, nitrogen regulation sensor histidine kinase NtrY